MEISERKFLVTGGAGFIGSHIVDNLLRNGASKVVVYDNFSSGSRLNLAHLLGDDRLAVVEGDILDFNRLRDVMRKVDGVSHQAAQLEIFRALSDPMSDLQVNVVGTLNVLRSALDCKIEKVVCASSACVYGQARYLPEDEDHPKRPHWPYGASKLSAEQYCTMYYEFYRLPVVSLRYGIVYGPREWYGRVLTVFLKRVLEDRAPVIFGDGLQTRDFVYVSDVVEAHELCIRSEKANGQVYNVGTETRTTMRDLAEKVINVVGKSLVPIYENPAPGEFSRSVPHRRRIPGELIDMVLDIKKARRELGWRPKTELDVGIRTEFEWLSKDPSVWRENSPKI